MFNITCNFQTQTAEKEEKINIINAACEPLKINSCPEDEVVLDGLGHLESPVVVQVEHVGWVGLPPVLPLVNMTIIAMDIPEIHALNS